MPMVTKMTRWLCTIGQISLTSHVNSLVSFPPRPPSLPRTPPKSRNDSLVCHSLLRPTSLRDLLVVFHHGRPLCHEHHQRVATTLWCVVLCDLWFSSLYNISKIYW